MDPKARSFNPVATPGSSGSLLGIYFKDRIYFKDDKSHDDLLTSHL